jgi:hypothetical protein
MLIVAMIFFPTTMAQDADNSKMKADQKNGIKLSITGSEYNDLNGKWFSGQRGARVALVGN